MGGTDVIVESIPIQSFGSTSGTITKDISTYVGQIGTLTFRLFPGSHCSEPDHANTYMWIDNVSLSGSLDTGSLMFISEPSGAQIFLAPAGQTPISQGMQTPNVISNLIAGQSYDYILRKTNFNNVIGTVTVQPGTTVVINKQIVTRD